MTNKELAADLIRQADDHMTDVLEHFLGHDQYGYRWDQPRIIDGCNYDNGMFWIPA